MPSADIDLNFNDHTQGRIRDLGDNLQDLGREAVRTRGRVEDLSGETGTLATRLAAARAQAQFMGERLDRAVTPATLRDFQMAERQVRALERSLRSIDRIRTPEIDVDVDIERNRFQRVFGGLVDQGQRAGFLAGQATITGFGSAMDALPSEVKLALGGAVAAAGLLVVPAIVAIIDAAILAGVGAGGLATGIVLAARDPEVKAAFGDLGEDILRDLTEAVAPFVPELVKSAELFGDAFEAQEPRINRIFAQLATAVVPISEELADGFEDMMPGLEAAVTASLPLLRILGQELHTILGLMGELFQAAADAGPSAALAFKFILQNVEALIVAITLLIDSMAPVTNTIALIGEKLGLWDLGRVTGTVRTLDDMGAAADGAAGAASKGITVYDNFAESMQNTADAADALNEAFDRLFSEAMDLDQANLQVKKGMLDLRATIAENGKTLDDNTAKGNANAEAILGQIEALDAKRQAEIAAGNGTKSATEQANAAYEANVAALRAVLIQLGLNAGAVDALIQKYAQIPRDIQTNVTTVYRTKGTPPGYSDQLTGHSRTGSTDYGADLSSWAAFGAEDRFQAAGDGGQSAASRIGGPRNISVESRVRVDLDGRPFRDYTDRSIAERDARNRWRELVGENR
jgi:hypothetical protein